MSHATDNLYETFARDDGGILKTGEAELMQHMCCMYGWNEQMHACNC